jgi:hypothetical protein
MSHPDEWVEALAMRNCFRDQAEDAASGLTPVPWSECRQDVRDYYMEIAAADLAVVVPLIANTWADEIDAYAGETAAPETNQAVEILLSVLRRAAGVGEQPPKRRGPMTEAELEQRTHQARREYLADIERSDLRP